MWLGSYQEDHLSLLTRLILQAGDRGMTVNKLHYHPLFLCLCLEVEGTGEWFPVLQTTLLVGVSHSPLALR